MNILRLLLILFVALLIGAVTANAQECPSPSGCVTITREAALKAIQDGDTVKAQATELAVKDKAIADLKDELDKMRIEFTRASSEATALKQQQVRDAAIIELLLKYTRPKKIGLINLF
jgi:hypothetical protein